MTNKELAVQLYAASLQAIATIAANPNFTGKVQTPTTEEMVKNVKEIADQLSTIQDN